MASVQGAELPVPLLNVNASAIEMGSPRGTSALEAARLTLARDIRLALRKRGQVIQPLVFFAINCGR